MKKVISVVFSLCFVLLLSTPPARAVAFALDGDKYNMSLHFPIFEIGGEYYYRFGEYYPSTENRSIGTVYNDGIALFDWQRNYGYITPDIPKVLFSLYNFTDAVSDFTLNIYNEYVLLQGLELRDYEAGSISSSLTVTFTGNEVFVGFNRNSEQWALATENGYYYDPYHDAYFLEFIWEYWGWLDIAYDAQSGRYDLIATLPGRDSQPDPQPAPTPEPATVILMGLGLAGLAAARRFRKQ